MKNKIILSELRERASQEDNIYRDIELDMGNDIIVRLPSIAFLPDDTKKDFWKYGDGKAEGDPMEAELELVKKVIGKTEYKKLVAAGGCAHDVSFIYTRMIAEDENFTQLLSSSKNTEKN